MMKYLVVKATTSSSVVAGLLTVALPVRVKLAPVEILSTVATATIISGPVMKMTFSRAILVTTPSTVVLVPTS